MAMFQRPGSNALQHGGRGQGHDGGAAKDFPKGLAYRIVYNPTEFIAQSIEAVYTTILEATALVVVVILLFLQTWRAAIIPIVAIPVSLIGTFGVMGGASASRSTTSRSSASCWPSASS